MQKNQYFRRKRESVVSFSKKSLTPNRFKRLVVAVPQREKTRLVTFEQVLGTGTGEGVFWGVRELLLGFTVSEDIFVRKVRGLSAPRYHSPSRYLLPLFSGPLLPKNCL